jgi:nitronate monooxygenase
MAKRVLQNFPWMKPPFIVGAPMRIMSGPELALAVSRAGGLGFIGPGAKPDDTITDLMTAKQLLKTTPFPSSTKSLPLGVGFQLWNGNINSATRAVQEHQPCAAWLFAPREGQKELDEWTSALRTACPAIHIWIQVGTLQESVEASDSPSPPNVLVVQGAEAGGHGRAHDGIGLMTLLPEVADAVRNSKLSLFAAGGISDGRGIAAALALGATGVALGTRFLASTEARIKKGYQQEIVRATNGAKSTTRTTLYNQLRGTNWPEQYASRGIVNKTWYDHQAGMPYEQLKTLHDVAEKAGDEGWGLEGRLATYAGAGVGMVNDVQDAGVLVERLRAETGDVINGLSA